MLRLSVLIHNRCHQSMNSPSPLPFARFQNDVEFHALGSSDTRGRLRRALCVGLVFALTASVWAARIDSVNRSAQCDGQGVDFSPFAEDDQALNNNSSQAGAFGGDVSLPIVLNDNISLYKAVQNSTVSLSALNFSGTGSIQTSQLTRFDSGDQASNAFLQGSAGSSFTVFFTMARSGKLSLSVALNAVKSLSGGVAPSLFGGSASFVQLSKGTTVVWSRYTGAGAVSFNGEVPLLAGQYQLTVSAAANVDTGSPVGEQFATTDASFSISGQIVESTGGGGGKKGK